MEISNLSNIVLQIFGRTLSFLQHVGILQAYSFNHSNVFYNSNAEKYLGNFISLLEEIKDILEKLQDLQKHKKGVEVANNNNTGIVSGDMMTAAPHYLTNAQMFGTEPMIGPEAELSSFIGSTVIEEYQVPEIVIETANSETSWITSQQKNTNEIKENVEDIPPPPPSPPTLLPLPSSLQPVRKSNFECTVCKKVLSSKAKLKSHMSIHTGQKSYCCEHCGKLFSSNMILEAHLTRQHNLNTESALACQECGKLFVRKCALEAHVKIHSGLKPWACQHCDRGFTQKVTRDLHQLTHTRDYKFRCDECGKCYPNQAKLNFHMKIHGEPQYACNVCDKLFATKQYLNSHYRTHDMGSETAHCRLDTVSTQMVVKPTPLYSCGQCSRSFPSQHQLTQHKEHRHYPYLKRKMAPRQKLSCAVCGKEFLHRASLVHHNRQQHSTELNEQQKRPFSCNLCLKRFTLRSKAALHLLTHSEAQHHCVMCDRMFRRKDSLQRHVNLMHGPVPRIICSMCQHSSATRGEHRQHIKTHSIHFPCAQCNKTFTSKMALSFHTKQVHEQAFKYQCNVCRKRFVRKCHYHDHMYSHSTERPFKCDICGKGFKNKKVCLEHTKRVHREPLATGNALSSSQPVGVVVVTPDNIAASEMNIDSLLAGDNATYGHTYDRFQACVQLQ